MQLGSFDRHPGHSVGFVTLLVFLFKCARYEADLLHPLFIYEPHHEKTCLLDFPPSQRKNRLYNHRR